MALIDQGNAPPGVMRGRRSLPGDLDRSGLVMPRRPIPTCGLALFSRLSDCLGVTIPDHSSTDLCQGSSSATVALGHITSPGRPVSRRHLSVDVRCRGGRAGGAMPRHDRHGGRTTRPETSDRVAGKYIRRPGTGGVIIGWMRQEASMPKHPITGDAGSRRRPRAMDAPRRAAWAAAFKKRNAGLEVWEMPAEEHAALLRPGLFEGLDEVAAQEEAACVLRYCLHEFDWSPIPPRGPTIAANWPSLESKFDAQHADEAFAELHPGQRGMTPTIGRRWIVPRGVASQTGPAVSRIRWPRGRSSVTGESCRPRRSLEVTMGAPPMRRRIGTWRWPRCFTCSDTWACTDRTCAVA